MAKATCSIEGCDRTAKTRGMCASHYVRWWRANPDAPKRRMKPRPPLDYWHKVDFNGPGGCWLWIGHITPNGYGQYGRSFAHRRIYQDVVRHIPDGLQLDHLCRVRHCVNPMHLEPVTQWENIARGNTQWAIVRRTGRCINGHDLTDPANLHINPKNPRRTVCRGCDRDRYHRNKKAGAGSTAPTP